MTFASRSGTGSNADGNARSAIPHEHRNDEMPSQAERVLIENEDRGGEQDTSQGRAGSGTSAVAAV